MSQQQTVLRVLTNVPGNISGSTVWAETTTYSEFQIVLFNGLSFVSLQNNNTGNIPNLEPTLYWQQVSNYEFLDLYTDIPIKINKSFAELQDISKKNTDYTIGLTIPGSKKNNKFFENFYNVDTQSLYFNANQRNQCDVLLGDEPLFRGYLKLNKVSVMNSKIEYDVTLYSTVSNLFGAIGNNLLKDLPFEDEEFQFNHEFNLSNVTQEFNFSNYQLDSEYPYPYVYPVLHSGYEYTGYTVNQSGTPINSQTRLYTSTANSSGQLDSYTSVANAWAAGVKQYQINSPTQGLMDNQLKPALNIWSLIQLMFKNYGYTIKSDFFNTPWIKNLYMYGYFASDGTKFSYKITSIQNLPVQGIELSYFQPNSKTIQIFVMKRGIGVPVYCLQDIRVFITLRVGSITINNVPYTVPAGTSGTTITNGTDDYTFIRGFSPQAPNGSKIQYTPKPIGTTVSYVDGDYVNFSEVIDPNIKQIDLLSSIAKKFNLIFISNPDVPNEIQIEPYDFYVGTGNIYDWTDKISYDKGFSVEPALNYVESDLTLTDLEDNDDGNKQYKDRNRLIYGQNNVYNPTNFKSQEKKIETIFGPELVRQWDNATQSGKIGLPLGINYSVSNQSDEEGQVRWLYKGLRTKPKLIFWLGGMSPFLDTVNETYPKRTYPTYNVYVSDSAASSYFTSDKLPAISNTMPIGLADEYKINNDSLSILFNSEETVDLTSVVRTYDTYTNFDAYNRFYNNRIRNIYNPNTRFLNGYFDLKYSDVKNLKANDIIKVQEQYFTWNKISEFNLTQRELTKCELIQLNVNPQTYPDRYFFYYYCDNPSQIYKFKTDFTNPNMLDSNYQWSIYYDRQVGSLTGSTSGFTALFKYIQSFSTVVYTPYTMYEVDETTYNASGITWTYDSLRNYIWDTGGAFSSFNMPTFWDNSGTTRTGVNVFENCTNFNTIKNTWGILTGSSTYFGVTPTPTPTITPTPTPVPTDDLRVRGSLIVTYDEETFGGNNDYFYAKVNGEYRDLQYSDSEELYSTYIYTGDTLEFCVVSTNAGYVVTAYEFIRRDYTIDDDNGDNGIIDTYITGWTGTSTSDPCSTGLVQVVTKLPKSYNFEYRIKASIKYPVPPTPTPTPIPDLCWNTTIGCVNDVTTDSDRNFYFAGTFTTEDYPEGAKLYVRKTDKNGNTVSFGGFGGVVSPGGSYAVTIQVDDTNDRLYIVNGTPLYGYTDPNNFTIYNPIIKTDFNGVVDQTFIYPISGGTGYNITAAKLQSNGKLVYGIDGYVSGTDYYNKYRINRLNTDGTYDTSFDPSTFSNLYSEVNAIAIQSDGKLVVATSRTGTLGSTKYKLVRLNSDGSIDGTFTASLFSFTGTTAAINVYALAIQSDGKILVGSNGTNIDTGGLFTSVSRNLVRLNTNGSEDTGFTYNMLNYGDNSGLDGAVRTIGIQSDGKIIAAGQISNYGLREGPSDIISAYRVIRFNSDGTYDNTFEVQAGPDLVNNGFNMTTGSIVNKVLVTSTDYLVMAGCDLNKYEGQDISNVVFTYPNGYDYMCPDPNPTPTPTPTPSPTPIPPLYPHFVNGTGAGIYQNACGSVKDTYIYSPYTTLQGGDAPYFQGTISGPTYPLVPFDGGNLWYSDGSLAVRIAGSLGKTVINCPTPTPTPTVTPTPTPTPTPNPLGTFALAISDNSSTGTLGYVYTSQDNFGGWYQNLNAGNRNFVDICASSGATYQTALVRPGLMYRSSDSGNTFTSIPAAGSRDWYYVDCSSDGQYQYSTSNGGTFKSSNYGSTWSLLTGTTSGYFYIATNSTGQYVVASRDFVRVSVSSNYGVSWTDTLLNSGTTSTINEPCISADGQYITVVGNGNYVYRSTNYGVNWSAISPSGANANWTRSSMSTSGQYQIIGNSTGGVYTSSDYGATWTARTNISNLKDVSSSQTGQYMAVCADSGLIYGSSDYGVNWSSNSGTGNWNTVHIIK